MQPLRTNSTARERGAEALVLDRAAAVDGAAGAEEDFERHAVADRAFAEAAVAVRVAVDEAGNQQSVGRIDAFGVLAA